MRYAMSAALALCLAFAATPLPAQHWSDVEKEVWKNVETYWGLYLREDLEAFMSYSHDDFLGWIRGDWAPTNKGDRRASTARIFETSQTVFNSLKPLGIRVHGDVAIVHYLYASTLKDPEGKEQTVRGTWTDILMKQGDRWIMIGDSGGDIPAED